RAPSNDQDREAARKPSGAVLCARSIMQQNGFIRPRNLMVLATFLHVSDLHLGHRFQGRGAGRLDPELPLSSRVLSVSEGLLGHHNKALEALDDFFGTLKEEALQKGEPDQPSLSPVI